MSKPKSDINGQIQSLNDLLGTRREEQRGLITTAEAEQRDLNDVENTRFNEIEAEIRSYQIRLERLKKLEEQEQDDAGNQRKKTAKEDQEAEQRAVADAMNVYLRRGMSGLNPEQRELLEARALSSVTGTAGAYTIPQGFANILEVALVKSGGILESATILDTETGNDIPHPTMNDTDNIGAILGENTTMGASTDPVFGVVNLKAYTYSSKPILVPNQLLEDSAFNLETYIAEALGLRIGRAFNVHGTTGTGIDQPQGLVAVSTKGADAAAAAITYDNLVDLMHSVDTLYRANGKFMMSDSTFKALRKLKDTTGQPIFQLSLRDSEPTTLLGKEVVFNNDMASIGASAKSIVFGDLSKYKVRRVKNYAIKRLVERYADLNQTGFILFVRMDGKLIDAGTHPIKHLLHAAS